MDVSLSILTIDYAKIQESLAPLEEAYTHLHMDVMDGVFVSKISFGSDLIASLRKTTNIPIDTHLMIVEPEKHIEDFAKAGSDMITFHIEATEKVSQTIDLIRSFHLQVGIALNPETPISKIEPYLSKVDLVLVMSVHPGYGGQKFIPSVVEKLKSLKDLKKKKQLRFRISVDGGINNETILAVQPYADMVVSGSYILKNAHPKEELLKWKHIFPSDAI